MKKIFNITFLILLFLLLMGCGNIINDYLNHEENPSDGNTINKYSISGKVSFNDIGFKNVKMFLSGTYMDETIEVETNSRGFFKFENLIDEREYWIYLYKEGYKFNPIRKIQFLTGSSINNLTFDAFREDKDILSYTEVETNDDGESIEKLKTYHLTNIIQLQYLMGYRVLEGNLEISDITLKTTEGLRSLQRITGDLRVYAHLNLKTLNGFNNLTTISGDLEINSSTLRNLKGLKSLKTVGGNINITVHPKFISVDDAEELVHQLEDFQGKALYFESTEIK